MRGSLLSLVLVAGLAAARAHADPAGAADPSLCPEGARCLVETFDSHPQPPFYRCGGSDPDVTNKDDAACRGHVVWDQDACDATERELRPGVVRHASAPAHEASKAAYREGEGTREIWAYPECPSGQCARSSADHREDRNLLVPAWDVRGWTTIYYQFTHIIDPVSNENAEWNRQTKLMRTRLDGRGKAIDLLLNRDIDYMVEGAGGDLRTTCIVPGQLRRHAGHPIEVAGYWRLEGTNLVDIECWVRGGNPAHPLDLHCVAGQKGCSPRKNTPYDIGGSEFTRMEFVHTNYSHEKGTWIGPEGSARMVSYLDDLCLCDTKACRDTFCAVGKRRKDEVAEVERR